MLTVIPQQREIPLDMTKRNFEPRFHFWFESDGRPGGASLAQLA